MIRISNAFRVTFADKSEKLAVVKTLAEAAAFYETEENPVTRITRICTGLQVILEDSRESTFLITDGGLVLKWDDAAGAPVPDAEIVDGELCITAPDAEAYFILDGVLLVLTDENDAAAAP